VPTLTNMALVQSSLGQVREAEGHYRHAVQRSEASGGSVQALCDYAVFLLRVRGDSARAEELLHRARLSDAGDADVLANLAALYLHSRGDADAAEQFFREALGANPAHALALAGMGVLVVRQAERAPAAPAAAPGAGAAGIRNALLRPGGAAGAAPSSPLAPGKRPGALSAASSAGADGGNAAQRALALIADRGDLGGPYKSDYQACAEQLFEEALRWDPHNLDALAHYAGLVHTVRRDYRRAAGMYDHALELSPTSPSLLNNAALLRMDMRQPQAAEFLLIRALEVRVAPKF
jgi:tetratricopeptide (TPR) repeat protein